MNACPSCLSRAPAGVKLCPTCGQPLDVGSGISMALTSGTLLQGKYKIERALGQGGFGITYQGTALLLKMPVAIKEYFPDRASRSVGSTYVTYKSADKSSIDTITTEAQAIARFNHPGIVRVFDVFEENNTAYIVMELLQGTTLEERIAQGPPLNNQEVIDIGIKVAEALSVVHQENLLHRDLKPANIFLAKDRVVLIDFGSAREFIQGKTVGHTRVLSPGYAPLEQYATAAKLGPYTDIYALGATLYHALTGYPPPDAQNRIQGVAIPPLSQGTPTNLQDAIMQALAVETGKRPQSTEEWIRLLQNASVPNSIPTTTPLAPQATQKTTRGLQRRLGRNWAIGGIMAGALLTGIWIWSAYINPQVQVGVVPIPSSNAPSDTSSPAPGPNPDTEASTPITSTQQNIQLTEEATLYGHTNAVTDVAFSPDGALLASGSSDKTIKLWSVVSNRELAVLEGLTGYVESVRFSPDGETLASSSYDGIIQLWDLRSLSEVATLAGHVGRTRSIAFSPDGKILASGGGHEERWRSDGINTRLWDVASGTEIAALGEQTDESGEPSHMVDQVIFSPDGKTLATGSGDGTIKLWNIASKEKVATLRGHTSSVNQLAFSPDGRILASGGMYVIKFWDTASKQEIATLQAHSDGIFGLTFSPDGQMLASGSGDATIKLWDVDTQQEITTLKLQEYTYSLAFSPDGTILAAANPNGTITLWRVKMQ